MGCVFSCLSSSYYYIKNVFFVDKYDYGDYCESVSLISVDNNKNSSSILLTTYKKNEKSILLKVDDTIEETNQNIKNSAIVSNGTSDNILHNDKSIVSGSKSKSNSKVTPSTNNTTSNSDSQDSQSKGYQRYVCDGCGNFVFRKKSKIVDNIVLCRFCMNLYGATLSIIKNYQSEEMEESLPSNSLIDSSNENLENYEDGDYSSIYNFKKNEDTDYSSLDNLTSEDIDLKVETCSIAEVKNDNEEENNNSRKRKREEEGRTPTKMKKIPDEFNELKDLSDGKLIYNKLYQIKFNCSICNKCYRSVDLFRSDSNWICINCRRGIDKSDVYDWTFKSKCGMKKCPECENNRDKWKFYNERNNELVNCLHCRNLKKKNKKPTTSIVLFSRNDNISCLKCEKIYSVIDCVVYEDEIICKECAKKTNNEIRSYLSPVNEVENGKRCERCKTSYPCWYFKDNCKTCYYCKIKKSIKDYNRNKNKEMKNSNI